jgi:hypothetical protein
MRCAMSETAIRTFIDDRVAERVAFLLTKKVDR